MKREIKFRNWDTRLKIWASPSYPLSMYKQCEFLVPQQYTGIKTHLAKKEIYEGNILEFKGDCKCYSGKTYVVEYSTPQSQCQNCRAGGR